MYQQEVAKVFEEKIVNNLVDLNMAQLYSLGLTPPGRQCGIVHKLFDPEEIKILESMSNEEQLHDLEESILINASQVMPGPNGQNHFSNISGKTISSGFGSSDSLADFNDLKKQMHPELLNEMMELKQRNQLQERTISEQNDYIKKLTTKVKKYQKEKKPEEAAEGRNATRQPHVEMKSWEMIQIDKVEEQEKLQGPKPRALLQWRICPAQVWREMEVPKRLWATPDLFIRA